MRQPHEAKEITLADVEAALRELDELSQAEYEISLKNLLLDTSELSAQRMQRLTGIALKRKFAKSAGAPEFSATGAKRSWPWVDSPATKASVAPREFALLNELRKPGPWKFARHRIVAMRTAPHP